MDEKTRDILKVVEAVGATIREVGEAPSGELYAVCSQGGMSLAQYNVVIATLKGAGLVVEEYRMLKWVGP